MNVAILEFYQLGCERVQQLTSGLLIRSEYVDKDKRLADLSLKLDEQMILGPNHIDYVLVNKADDFDLARFQNNLPHDNQVCFMSQKSTGSFFCRPNIISIIGNLYKIDFASKFTKSQFDKYFLPHDSDESHAAKLFYVIDRLGIDLHVI